MPHLNFKNISLEEVKKFSIENTSKLANIFGCPEDHLTFDFIESTCIFDGQIVKGDNTIIIQMFERNNEIKSDVAKLINAYFVEAVVIFDIIEEKNYFENGINFE